MRWAARLYRHAVTSLHSPSRRHRRSTKLHFETLEARETPTVSGTVYADLNQNGTQDGGEVGVAGVTVRATDANGVAVTATTASNGSYTLSPAAGTTAVRIEFGPLPEGTLPGRVTATNGPLVRFLDASTNPSNVNLGLNRILLATQIYAFDEALAGANAASPAIVTIGYGADGVLTNIPLASVSQVGSTWGLAYQTQSDSVYASAFLKRHSGFGPNSYDPNANPIATSGGLYRIDRANANDVSVLLDLRAVPAGLLAVGDTAANYDTGANPHPLAADPVGDWFHDAAAFPLVGKRGLGGLAVSADGRTLYTVNLNTKRLIEIPINLDGTLDLTRTLRSTPVPAGNPTGSGITSFTATDLRPFAVSVRNGKVFVGTTYTAETSGTQADLRAFVYAFDPTAGAFGNYDQATDAFTASASPTPVMAVNLTYPRGYADNGPPPAPGAWRPWTTTFASQPGGDATFLTNPAPWLTDIVFDGSTMVLGLRDRFGDQGGFQTGDLSAGSTSQFSVIAAGDILRAAASGAGWQLESNGSSGGVTTNGAGNGQGPGGGEFYFQDNFLQGAGPENHQEVVSGGLAQVPGFGTIAATGMDPLAIFSGGVYTFRNTDSDPSAATNAGTAVSHGQVYESLDSSTFGKSNGMGDLVAMPASPSIQIGHRVWTDTNNNGIQDAGEPGIAGVTVQLFQGAALAGTTTTDSAGQYLFVGLAPNTPYEIRLATAQPVLGGATLVAANAGTNDSIDSDATVSSGTAIIPLTTGTGGTNDHTFDFGFTATAAATFSLGNTVWDDANNNGLRDAGEAGVPGVLVELLDGTGIATGQTATTDGSGTYAFTGLAAGSFRVRLAASNFLPGGALVGFTSSTGTNGSTTGPFEGATTPGPDDNLDDRDHGRVSGTLGQAGGVIVSSVGTFVAGGAASNQTVDFGVFRRFSLGNVVFRDSDNSGAQNGAEAGIAGVAVRLLDSTGTTQVATATTDAQGQYLFTNLIAGDYIVEVASSNFLTGGSLVGFTSSTGGSTEPAPDPDTTITDGDDNGTTVGTLGQAGGTIRSTAVTLGPTANEPTGETPNNDATGTPDNQSNLTVDFGVVPPAAAGPLSLGDTVWNDVNNNGLLDTGETGVAGVTVQLTTTLGAVLQTATTDAQGRYLFTGLAAGDYVVRLPAVNFTGAGVLVGFTSSTGTNGATTGPFEGALTPDPDNDVNNDDNGNVSAILGSGGFIESKPITLTVGGEPITDGDTDPNTNLTVDFGVFRKFSIGNVVFNDANNNGLQGSGETGVGGVAVRLLNATGATQVATTTTSGQGQYLFSNLIAGDYIVEIAASNFATGGPLFAFQSSTGGTGTLFEGANTPNPNTNPTDGDDNGTTTGTLGSGGVIRSAAVTLGPTANEPTGESPNNDPNTPDAQSNLAVDFGVFQAVPSTASVAGRVFLDYNNNGAFNGPDTPIAGVTVTLTGGSLAAALTTLTDASGNYAFTNLAAGTYTLTETQPTAPPNVNGNDTAGTAGGANNIANIISAITLAANQAATGYTFAEVPLIGTGGTVFEDLNGNNQKDAAEPGIAGVTVTLTGTSVVSGSIVPVTATTDATGAYRFDNITPGTYTIAETQPAAFLEGGEQNGTPAATTVTPNRFTGINLTNSAAASSGFNFGEVRAASIAGVAFDDPNNNGTQDAGETGIAGVTVRLTGTANGGVAVNRTATTDANGAYNFAGLQPGTYRLAETQPSRYLDGLDTAGTAGGSAAVNDVVSNIVLASATAATGYLFAEHAAPDMTIAQAISSGRHKPGDIVTLTYTATNRGSGNATGVTAALNLAGLQFVSASSTNFNPATNQWTLGTVTPGQSDTLTIQARVPARGTFTPTARVSATNAETTLANNSDSDPLTASSAGVSKQSFLSSKTDARRVPLGGTVAAPTPAPTPPPPAPRPPVTPGFALAAASDTGILGDGRTDLSVVTLSGTTSPNATVTLVQTGATARANAAGLFSFASVPLVLGANSFTVRATTAAGGTSQATRTITRNNPPVVSTPLTAVNLATGGSTILDLAGNFDDADITNSQVRLNTSSGAVNITLFDRQAPRTVANFLNYIVDGKYTDSIFHRSAKLTGGVPFVLQGGGFNFQASPPPTRLGTIVADPAVKNEPDAVNRSNLRGTIAMAKLGSNPDSATDQFFFNLGNNASNLDNQNGGFTVFGRLVGATDQAVVDTLAAIPTQNQGTAIALPPSQQGVFTEIPLRNYTGTAFPTDTVKANFATVNTATVVRRTELLTYSIVGNTNPTAVITSIVHNRLTLTAGVAGTATITIRATDQSGSFVNTTVTVTVA